jgi:peroxiredoxin
MKTVLSSISLIFFTRCLSIAQADSTEDRGYIVRVGDIAPDFTIELITGERVALSSLKGKVVMLQFTASWCGVCRKEMPYIEKEIWQILKNNTEFALIAIDRDEPIEIVKSFSDKVGITYPIGLDPDANIFSLFAFRQAGITRNVIIDREGRIIFLTRLFDEKEFDAMKNALFAQF